MQKFIFNDPDNRNALSACLMTGCLMLFVCVPATVFSAANGDTSNPRERVAINENWRFYKYDSVEEADDLVYDVRPSITGRKDEKTDSDESSERGEIAASRKVLKPWILPTGNDFVNDPSERYTRPEGNPGSDFPFVQDDFDDSSWEKVDLPHDWAIEGPFYEGKDAEVGGSMGRLPSPGVAWYRKTLDIPASDSGKCVFLDVNGAMSYAMVWFNGHLVGGWPYGYASWRVDLTPYIDPGGENQLAIRLDNPPESSRWYPGGGIYRKVWLTKTNPIHVPQWGTFITTPAVSVDSASVNLEVTIDNNSGSDANIESITKIYALNADGSRAGDPVATYEPVKTTVPAGRSVKVKGSLTLDNPKLWGPPPTQTPNLYVAVTSLSQEGNSVDTYETRFGIRSLRFNPDSGIYVNGEHIKVRGVNLHHDLGPLGAAFNVRAAERRLDILREMGCNAIRTAHNPPSPKLLELTDRMGFLVVDEIFDVWKREKTPLDFHLIFPDWYEQDLRAFIRRDRNHPSVIMWSVGNEVGEQYTEEGGAEMGRRLRGIVAQEDPSRPSTASMNFAKPDAPMPEVVDVISLNYQGEGIRNAPAYSHLRGITTPPIYPEFHEAFPGKVILSSENAAALSTRGTYMFPVFDGISAPVSDSLGGDPENWYVSAYELHTADFGSSADKVFASLDKHPYVAGGFVWAGWDYLGEPTPYYGARSSYFGIIDLAGFLKDRFYLYQSHWRPNHPTAHILPHWNWPERHGEVTPVHVFTSGDEAELFLNGESLGRKAKGKYEYRLRWDNVKFEPGELKVVAYKNGEQWAEDMMKTTGDPAQLQATADRTEIRADGDDLAFVRIQVADENGLTVPTADNTIKFSLEGPGEIVATANGDPTNMTPFPSHKRKAFNGLCLVIVKGTAEDTGEIKVTATSASLQAATVTLETTND